MSIHSLFLVVVVVVATQALSKTPPSNLPSLSPNVQPGIPECTPPYPRPPALFLCRDASNQLLSQLEPATFYTFGHGLERGDKNFPTPWFEYAGSCVYEFNTPESTRVHVTREMVARWNERLWRACVRDGIGTGGWIAVHFLKISMYPERGGGEGGLEIM